MSLNFCRGGVASLAPCDSLLVRAWIVGFLAIFLWAPAESLADPGLAMANFESDIQPLLARYCFDCHARGAEEGGISFDKAREAGTLLRPELWLKAVKNVRAGVMPPLGNPRPTAGELATFENWIKRDVFAIDPQNPDPGRVVYRRLNRNEYKQTIKDLFGYEFDVDTAFPPDDTGSGFDNIASVLSVSPMLLDKYMSAAEKIVRANVPGHPRAVQEQILYGVDFVQAEKRVRGPENRDLLTDARVSFGEAGKFPLTVRISEPGDYRIEVHYGVYGQFDYERNRANIIYHSEGEELHKRTHVWEDEKHGQQVKFQYTRNWKPGLKELAFEVEPLSDVGAEDVPPGIVEGAADAIANAVEGDPAAGEAAGQRGGRGRGAGGRGGRGGPRGTRITLRIVDVKIVGPLDPAQWVQPKNYARYFSRDLPPTEVAERREYAREVLGRFASKALRRPADDETLNRLVELAELSYSQPGATFEQGIQQAMIAVLSSPRFLFRIEDSVPAARPGERASLIDEYSLAGRLSYLLWSSMPDEELFALAEQGELRKHLPGQVQRMIADERSDNFVKNFVGQWLRTREVDTVDINSREVLQREAAPEPEAANPPGEEDGGRGAAGRRGRGGFGRGGRGGRGGPQVNFDTELRQAMRAETDEFFRHVVHENRPVLELVDSDYTFLNERLAGHYKIEGVSGPEMRKVELKPEDHRGGVLTHGSILTITSQSTRTSAVKRGLFLLDNILGAPAPPPPPDVPPLEDSAKEVEGRELTLRETLEVHRAQAVCSSCHSRMDPLGLAFENYNALGMWRTKERGQDILIEGRLITGEKLASASDLRKILAGERRKDFYRCLTEKLLIYAIGRDLEYYDLDAVDRIVDRLEQDDGRFMALLMGVVESAPFQMRRNFDTPPAEAARE